MAQPERFQFTSSDGLSIACVKWSGDRISVAGAYIFRNRNRFFGRDPNVSDDIPAVRRLRIEVILIPWLFLTLFLVILLVYLWSD